MPERYLAEFVVSHPNRIFRSRAAKVITQFGFRPSLFDCQTSALPSVSTTTLGMILKYKPDPVVNPDSMQYNEHSLFPASNILGIPRFVIVNTLDSVDGLVRPDFPDQIILTDNRKPTFEKIAEWARAIRTTM